MRLAPGMLLAAALLAGCASGGIEMRSAAPPSMRGTAPLPGASYRSATVSAEVSASPIFALLFVGAFAAGIADHGRAWGEGVAARAPPPLAEDRNVAERDCTRPMDVLSANLRCK